VHRGEVVLDMLAGREVSVESVRVRSIPVFRQSCGCGAAGITHMQSSQVVASSAHDWTVELRQALVRRARGESPDGSAGTIGADHRHRADCARSWCRPGGWPPSAPGSLFPRLA